MNSITTYLTFNGNCREAMEFYRECLGGDLELQTIGESPISYKMPKNMKNYVLHATLTRGELVLMGSDMVSDRGLVRGNAVSLALQCNSHSEINRLFEQLSDGGEQLHPLELSFWGALFGDLVDKFGNHWLLHFEHGNGN